MYACTCVYVCVCSSLSFYGKALASKMCGLVMMIIILTQKAAIALEPLTTHPDEWAEPSHK